MDFTKKKGTVTPFCMITDGYSNEEIDALTACTPAIPENVIVTVDHDTPSGTVAVAEKQKKIINYAKEQKTPFYYGRGIGYHIAMDQYLKEGDIVVGLNQHITTVGAVGAIGIQITKEQMEEVIKTGRFEYELPEILKIEVNSAFENKTTAYDFALSLIEEHRSMMKDNIIIFTHAENLTHADRVTVCNLLSNAGVYSATFASEEPRAQMKIRCELEQTQKMAVLPGSFDKIVPSTAVDGLRVNQVFIGGCMGGTIETMRQVAKAFEGKHVDKYVRVMIAPATSEVYAQMIDENLVESILDSGALLMNQGCSACWAQSQGLVDDNEVFVTTGSINCENWAGKNNNKIYITSPTMAIKCALVGSLYEN